MGSPRGHCQGQMRFNIQHHGEAAVTTHTPCPSNKDLRSQVKGGTKVQESPGWMQKGHPEFPELCTPTRSSQEAAAPHPGSPRLRAGALGDEAGPPAPDYTIGVWTGVRDASSCSHQSGVRIQPLPPTTHPEASGPGPLHPRGDTAPLARMEPGLGEGRRPRRQAERSLGSSLPHSSLGSADSSTPGFKGHVLSQRKHSA